MKTIALERGLEELKQALEEHGYNTVFADEMILSHLYCRAEFPGRQAYILPWIITGLNQDPPEYCSFRQKTKRLSKSWL